MKTFSILHIRLITMICFMLISIPSYAGYLSSISHTETFSYDNVSSDTVSDTWNTYTLLKYEGLKNTVDPGEVSLPVKYLTFSVPYDARNFTMYASSSKKKEYLYMGELYKTFNEHESNLVSVQSDLIGIEGPITVTENCAEIVSRGFVDGCNQVITVAVYPIRPINNRSAYTFYEEVSFTITWNKLGLQNEPEAILPQKQRLISEGLSITKQMVLNPSNVEANAPTSIMPLDLDADEFAYIIISNFDEKYFDRLLELRRIKGFASKYYKLDDILNRGSGTDKAKILRDFLEQAWVCNGTKNVLLVGSDIPYKKIKTKVDKTEYEVASDIYLGDFNTNWNTISENVVESEYEDGYCEINIGRVPAVNEEHLVNYIEKVIQYELNPGDGDASYLNRALMTRQDRMILSLDCFKDDKITDFLSIYGTNLIDMTEHNGVPTGSSVIQQLNMIPTGLQNFIGHGNPGGVAVSSDEDGQYYAIIAKNNENTYHLKESGNGIDCLNNNKYPCWSYSMSCSLMPFETRSAYSHLIYNFGASYILSPNSGGIVFMGNTEVSFLRQEEQLMNDFFRDIRLFSNRYSITQNTSGTKIGLIRHGSQRYHTRCIHNLYGDPLIPLWVQAPYKISYNITHNGYSIETDSESPLYIATRPLIDPCYARIEQLVSHEKDSILDNNVYSIYSATAIPCVLPLTIKGHSFRPEHRNYIMADSVCLGVVCDDEYAPERVKLLANSEVTIEANGNVEINSGIFFENNSVLKIRAKGYVWIGNVVVPPTVTLIIDSDHEILDYGENIFLPGSTVIFNGVSQNRYNSSRKRKNIESPAFPEGRTWWYSTHHVGMDEKAEYGITIGDKIERNGETWNKINLVTRCFTDLHGVISDESVNKSAETIAYIRQDGKNICFDYNYGFDFEPIDMFIGWLDTDYCEETPIMIYNFDTIGTEFHLGRQSSEAKYEVNAIREVTNAGYQYKEFTYSSLSNVIGDHKTQYYIFPKKLVCIEGIGTISCEGGGIAFPLFFAPFGDVCACYPFYDIPKLRYVTQGEENTVIYEDEGGLRLWEAVEASVSEIEAEDHGEARWFTIQGVAIPQPSLPGIYLKRTGVKTEKVRIAQ